LLFVLEGLSVGSPRLLGPVVREAPPQRCALKRKQYPPSLLVLWVGTNPCPVDGAFLTRKPPAPTRSFRENFFCPAPWRWWFPIFFIRGLSGLTLSFPFFETMAPFRAALGSLDPRYFRGGGVPFVLFLVANFGLRGHFFFWSVVAVPHTLAVY